MIRPVLFCLMLAMTTNGCKGKSVKPSARPADAKATPAPEPEPTKAAQPPGPPIEAITLPALSVEPSKAIVQKLIRAHYDPQRLGLKRLSFTARITLKNKSGTTIIAAKGSWAEQAPEISIQRVVRDGKQLDQKDKLNETLWESLKFRSRRLLDGIGQGFLHRRLEGFKEQQGTAKMDAKNKQLLLTYKDDKAGETTFTIASGYRVVRLHNVSPVGVTRTMSYKHRTVGGRNLVTLATMKVEVHKGAKLPDKGIIVMKASDGMRFRIDHAKVGRFLLPHKLHRVMPNSNDDLLITLKYDH